MPVEGQPSHNDEGQAPKLMPCPFCQTPVWSDIMKSHLVSEHSSLQALEKILTAELNPPNKTNPTSISSAYIPVQGREGVWYICSMCGEEVRNTHLTYHKCPTDRIYIEDARLLGTAPGRFVESVKRIVRENPGLTARDLAELLGYEYGKFVDRSIVNSVLYSFKDRPFRKDPDSDEFYNDDIFPPRWYYG